MAVTQKGEKLLHFGKEVKIMASTKNHRKISVMILELRYAVGSNLRTLTAIGKIQTFVPLAGFSVHLDIYYF